MCKLFLCHLPIELIHCSNYCFSGQEMTEIMKKVEDLVLFGNIEEVQEEEGVVAVKEKS